MSQIRLDQTDEVVLTSKSGRRYTISTDDLLPDELRSMEVIAIREAE